MSKQKFAFDYLFDADAPSNEEFRKAFTIQDIEDMAWYEEKHQ
jgi:hypothetical protein